MKRVVSPWWFASIGIVLAGLAMCSGIVSAEPGVVWFTIESESKEQVVHFKAPLEWLAGPGWGDRKAEIDGVSVDLVALWLKYRDLPVGRQIKLAEGLTDEGEPYSLHVLSRKASAKTAEGKIHLLARDEDGKTIDLRFPLNIPALILNLVTSLPIFEGSGEMGDEPLDERFPPIKELKQLGGYGPFLLLEVIQEEPQLKITVE